MTSSTKAQCRIGELNGIIFFSYCGSTHRTININSMIAKTLFFWKFYQIVFSKVALTVEAIVLNKNTLNT